ncbi:hypothetical protein CAPTEDRAFT_200986 [Capitella teleta]|uniref:Major facilitator superfamily (MFS) profile domain-containing protein n=1 Tax=Capitella teleta TaxID=283909 RepID=R7VFM6_CAPTE|nr:hypothetical protein CAPTEDRAFT_200986 [Capitella teleta]|eukprot:ELU17377.1 hypothetical protein CAPTEDRAFT_200986 [Capitella teleta]
MAELVGDGLLTQPQATWFGSLVTIGAISGGPLAAVFVEKVGRKTTLMLICLPYTVGWLFIILADNYIFLFAGRLITGLSVGATSLATPLYIAEVASKEMRGFLGAGFQLFVVAGIEVVYCLGIVLNFRWLAVSAVAISALQILCLCCMPETPRWLLGTMQRNKALDALRWLRGPDYPIEDECFDIETNMEAQREEEFSLKDFARPSLYHPLTISIFLMIFQQFSGVNAVIFYSADIMESAGFGENSKVAAVAIGGVQVVATAIACCLMDAAGRRLLLLIAGIFMTLSCVTFGTYYYLVDVHKIGGLSWLSLGSLILYVTAFSLGWGPIPWLIMSEVFPGRAKGMASGIVTTVNWCCAFLVTKEFHDLQVAITEYGVFWLFGSICALSIAFVAIFVPETKGRSLEEIEATFNHRSIST